MGHARVGIIHYSAPPVIGGVERVIAEHVRLLVQLGYQTAVITGRGDPNALPKETEFIKIAELDSQHPLILEISSNLERGKVPEEFFEALEGLKEKLVPVLAGFDKLIVHNIFTKHFNLPLTAALVNLLDGEKIKGIIAWCHDLTWTSPSSGSKVHPGYPWDLIRSYHPKVQYVVVSTSRQSELAGLFGCPTDRIEVIYNGVDPTEVLGLSLDSHALISRLEMLESDINLLMPVRVTKAKNIEYALEVTAAIKNASVSPKLVLTGPPDPHDSMSMEYYQSLLELRRNLGVDNEMRFVFESGPNPDQGYLISSRVVGDLLRISDVMFMPSHREGFGMPVLEAGLAGIPVVSTGVPAAVEIAADRILIFQKDQPAEQTAQNIINLVNSNPISRLRRQVLQNYTWKAIFKRQIEPLLNR
jgi:glycosyltransferase involved in cell wall biosynthesis